MRIDLARRAATLALACALPLVALAPAAGQARPASTSPSAQAWPQRPIKMICPFPAGGGTDLIARLAAKHLSDRLGQQVYVENRGGANGAIGLQALMQADPDGYTIGAISDGPIVANPGAVRKARLSAAARLHPGRHDDPLPVDAGRASRGRHPQRGRADRARQGKARRAELFVRRHRQFQPSRPRAARAADRHQAAARAVSRRRPGDAWR